MNKYLATMARKKYKQGTERELPDQNQTRDVSVLTRPPDNILSDWTLCGAEMFCKPLGGTYITNYSAWHHTAVVLIF